MKEKCLRPFLFAALVLAVCFAGSVAQAATVIVGTCQTGVQFATIQAAVNASFCSSCLSWQSVLQARLLMLQWPM